MALIIDSHAHVFPDRLRQLTPDALQAPLEELRRRARSWLRPVTGTLHQAQTYLRHLPQPIRRALDEVGGLAPLPSLLIESTVNDLTDALSESCVDHAIVIAHPPLISNEFLLEACQEDSRLLPVVNIPAGTPRPGSVLKDLASRGAIALKIHPASDGEGPDSLRYKALLKSASELGLPVIVHTGCFHTHLFYKSPHLGDASRYKPWFEAHPEARFILAHMNFHEPQAALDLMEEHANVFADTSWQPAEVIGEAVRRVGAERILFGSDWPFVGANLDIGLARVRTCIDAGTVTEEQSRLILGENAARLFGIDASGA